MNENVKDDFKVIFDTYEELELPAHLEDKIMAGIQEQKSLSYQSQPRFSKNLGLFSLSLFLLSISSIFQFFTKWDFPMLLEVQQVLMLSVAIFFCLWMVEIFEARFQKTTTEKGLRSKMFTF